jgi:hypothetical protein
MVDFLDQCDGKASGLDYESLIKPMTAIFKKMDPSGPGAKFLEELAGKSAASMPAAAPSGSTSTSEPAKPAKSGAKTVASVAAAAATTVLATLV